MMKRSSGASLAGVRVSAGGRVSAGVEAPAIDRSRAPRTSVNANAASGGSRGRSSSTERGRPTLAPNGVLRQRSSSSGNVPPSPAMLMAKVAPQRAPDFRKDKDENIRIVVKFLTDYRYPGQCNPKQLLSPSNREYFNIFQFIYSLLDPGYELSPRPDDDIPALYKALGYPYAISRSALLTVATPHTWPLLLHALCWLIGLAQQTEWVSQHCDDIIETTARCGEGKARDAALFALYTEEAYDQYMAGENSFDAIDDKFMQNMVGPTAELDEARELNERLTKELQQLEQAKDSRAELESTLAQMERSQAELVEYSANLALHDQQLQVTSAQLVEQLKAAKQELEEVEMLRDQLQYEFDTQALSEQDIERMHQERSTVRQTIETLKQDIDAYNQKQWEAEMAISSAPVAAKCAKFNLALSRCLHGDTGLHAVDYELKPAFGRGLQDDKSETVVKPLLCQLLQESANATAAAVETNKTCLKEIEEAESELALKENDVLLQENKLATMESNFSFEKQRLQGALESLQHQLASLQQELAELAQQKAKAALTKEELSRSIYDVRLSLEAKKKKNKQSENAMSSQLLTAVEMSLEMKTSLDASVAEVVSKCSDSLAKMKSDCATARALYSAAFAEVDEIRSASGVHDLFAEADLLTESLTARCNLRIESDT